MVMSKTGIVKQIENTPITSLFQVFKLIAKDDITWLKTLANTSTNDVHIDDLHKLMQEIAFYRDAIYQISEKGLSENPYAVIKPKADPYTTRRQPHEDLYEHYLKTLLPSLTGNHFYAVWRYEYLSAFALIDGVCHFATLILDEQPINYDELAEVWKIFTDVVNQFEAITLASAEFEKQLFGEGKHA